jgi:hypothetical protein
LAALIEKIKKRKVKLKLLRSKLNFSSDNKTFGCKNRNAIDADSDDDDDETSELDDLNVIITQSKQHFNEQSLNALKADKTNAASELAGQSSFFNNSSYALKSLVSTVGA